MGKKRKVEKPKGWCRTCGHSHLSHLVGCFAKTGSKGSTPCPCKQYVEDVG